MEILIRDHETSCQIVKATSVVACQNLLEVLLLVPWFLRDFAFGRPKNRPFRHVAHKKLAAKTPSMGELKSSMKFCSESLVRMSFF